MDQLMGPISYRHKQQNFEYNYPDTLRYRDSFNLQILMHLAFKIWVLRKKSWPQNATSLQIL